MNSVLLTSDDLFELLSSLIWRSQGANFFTVHNVGREQSVKSLLRGLIVGDDLFVVHSQTSKDLVSVSIVCGFEELLNVNCELDGIS